MFRVCLRVQTNEKVYRFSRQDLIDFILRGPLHPYIPAFDLSIPFRYVKWVHCVLDNKYFESTCLDLVAVQVKGINRKTLDLSRLSLLLRSFITNSLKCSLFGSKIAFNEYSPTTNEKSCKSGIRCSRLKPVPGEMILRFISIECLKFTLLDVEVLIRVG